MSPDEKPVLIAYDGSDHAKYAIEQAGAELRTPRKAVVLAAFEALPASFDLVSPGRTPLRIPTSGDDLLGEQLPISVRQLHHGVSYFFQ